MAKTLFKAVLMVAVFSVITRVLGFVFRIYLSRKLGAELLGIYQISATVFMCLILLVASGIPVTVSKLTAKYEVQKNKNAVHKVATSALIIGILVSFGVWIVFLLFGNFIEKIFADKRCYEILLILLPAVFMSAIYSAFRGVLWGKKDYFSVGYTELFEQVVRIVLFVVFAEVFLIGVDGSILAGISMSLACVSSCLLVIFVYFKKGGRLCFSKEYLKPVFKSSAPITGVRVASSLIQPIIAVLFPFMLVLGGTNNETALALYGMAMGMTFPLLFLPSTLIGSLSFALIPELSSALEKKETKLVTERVKSGMLFSVVVSALIVPIYMAFGTEICELLFNNSLSGQFLSFASLIMLPLGLSNISSSILNAFNLEVKSFVNNIIGGIVLIVFVVCFSGMLQVYALILGFGACMLITTVLNIIMLKKHSHIKLSLVKPTILSLLFIVPSVLLSKSLFSFLSLVFPQIFALALGMIVAGGVFLILCVLFRVCDFAFIFSKVKIKPKISQKQA